MLGIYIHNMKDSDGKTDSKGGNPFSKWNFQNSEGKTVTYPTYDWVNEDGYNNLGDWIEAAAKESGR